MADSEIFVDNVLSNHHESTKNEDGSYTYKMVLNPFEMNWHSGATDYTGEATVTVEVTLPAGTPVPGPGGIFRFAGNGGYIVAIWGSDFNIPDGVTYTP